MHDELGRGWVWGSGRGVVTVRFETAETEPGPVRSYAVDCPELQRLAPAGAGRVTSQCDRCARASCARTQARPWWRGKG